MDDSQEGFRFVSSQILQEKHKDFCDDTVYRVKNKPAILDLLLQQLVRFSHTVGREGETAVGYRF